MIDNLTELVATAKKRGEFGAIASNVALQFGTKEEPLLFSTLMPERLKANNSYDDHSIEYFSLIGNSGSDYSPSQLNPGGQLVGSFSVRLGRNDQADTLSAQAYDTIREILELSSDSTNNRDMAAMTELLMWFDRAIAQPLMRLGELHRANAVIDAEVLRTGSNGYSELVRYPNPPGQRINVPSGTVASPTGWFGVDPNYNPLEDLLAVKRAMKAKGRDCSMIISSYEAFSQFMQHPGVRSLFNGVQLTPGTNQFSPTIGAVSQTAINGLLTTFELPQWTIYDRTYNYRDVNGSIQSTKYVSRPTYLPIIMLAKTALDQRIDLGLEKPLILKDTIGYYGLGRLGGQATPGRVSNNLMTQDQYPEILRSEMLEIALPIISIPEAIYVLKILKPTP